MPEEGLNFSKKSQVLSYEEMLRLITILAEMGISKVRITGGEPFVRKDLIPFMGKVKGIEGIEKLSITTNGTGPLNQLDELKSMGIEAVNLSLDTLDPQRFHRITRRDEFDSVWQYYQQLMAAGITTKINAVVMEEHNLDDIIPMCELTKNDAVSIRFIEEMPFNGGSKGFESIKWNQAKIIDHIQTAFPDLVKLEDETSSTSYNYQIPGAKGSIGVIPAYTRSICGSCDRIRLTPKGELKTCLYQNEGFSFRDFMREGATDEEIRIQFKKLFSHRAKDGFESEKSQHKGTAFQSMATIGG